MSAIVDGQQQRTPNGAIDFQIIAFPLRVCAAFEFRHVSWLDEEIYARLRARNLSLCVADSEKLSTPVEITADYAYFRLRDEGYGPADIDRWAKVIQQRTGHCRDVYVYFKHEESGKGRNSRVRSCARFPSKVYDWQPVQPRRCGMPQTFSRLMATA